MRHILLSTIAALALLSSPVLASYCGDRGDQGNPGGPAGGGNPGGNQSSNADPGRTSDPGTSSGPGESSNNDENTVFAGQFGGSLCADPVTSRMVSDWAHGGRSLDHIQLVHQPGGVVCLIPIDNASWTERPVLFR